MTILDSEQTGQAASGAESLPTSPMKFQQDQPDIFKRVYGNDADDQPVINLSNRSGLGETREFVVWLP